MMTRREVLAAAGSATAFLLQGPRTPNRAC